MERIPYTRITRREGGNVKDWFVKIAASKWTVLWLTFPFIYEIFRVVWGVLNFRAFE